MKYKALSLFWSYLKNASWSFITLPVVTALLYFSAEIYIYFDLKNIFKDIILTNFFNELVDYFKLHPFRIFISVSVMGVLIGNSILLWKSNALIKSFGIFSFSPHVNSHQKNIDWQQFIEIMGASSTLKILGSTGYDTFKSKESPLYNMIKDSKEDINILLLSPDSSHVFSRAKSLNISVTKYRDDIKKSIQYLRELKKTNNLNISLRVYDSELDWKMLIANNFLWLQYYTNGTHVDSTPVYGFYTNENLENSLYSIYQTEFIKRWTSSKKIEL